MTFRMIDDGSDRERWLDRRTGGVSATDAARIMTGGATGWASLRAEKATGRSFGGNMATRHGREREEVIAAFAEHEFGLIPSTALLAHGELTTDLATPDALSLPYAQPFNIPEEDGLALGVEYEVEEFGEYKTTVKDWPTRNDIPARYFWQIVWQFHVTGARRCRFVFEPHVDFVPIYMQPRVFTFERHEVEDEIEKAIARVGEWRSADLEELPEEFLELDDLVTAHTRAKESAEAAQAVVDELAERIRPLLKEFGRPFEGSEAVASLGAEGTRTSFNRKAFEARFPHVAKKFITETTAKGRLSITARS
ncbi:YqaJ viral recombinase family protein [Microbacterium caowuchunii]|uniref:YqaJ viral recombinase family protein n=1 Tax=Microbacterium caowuchunii TaxID=2614638 RepID=A0A5N0TGM1_9MICO|nr:YqaJ viral recombinase family protein [Microbacterium caowuchunii]KAA9133731.1 YqaJ viral recombinase family protein [Microbacterium caowuchunii]